MTGCHNGPGRTSVKSSIEGIIAENCNEVDYASDVSGMERHMHASPQRPNALYRKGS